MPQETAPEELIEVPEDALTISIRIKLGMVKFAYGKRFLEENERDRMAAALVAHFKLCGWRVMHEDPRKHWHSVRYGKPANDNG